MCCEALTADCLACSLGMTVEEYCLINPNEMGCEQYAQNDAIMCCMAMTADCLACSAGLTVEEYCLINPNEMGCE